MHGGHYIAECLRQRPAFPAVRQRMLADARADHSHHPGCAWILRGWVREVPHRSGLLLRAMPSLAGSAPKCNQDKCNARLDGSAIAKFLDLPRTMWSAEPGMQHFGRAVLRATSHTAALRLCAIAGLAQLFPSLPSATRKAIRQDAASRPRPPLPPPPIALPALRREPLWQLLVDLNVVIGSLEVLGVARPHSCG